MLESVADAEGITAKKNWFYFKMIAQKGIKVRLIIQNVALLDNIYEVLPLSVRIKIIINHIFVKEKQEHGKKCLKLFLQ